MNFELTGISGHSPYDIYICDITDSYCYLVDSGITTIPPSIELITPSEFGGVEELLIKIIDSEGCKFFRYYTCITPTPTTTTTTTTIPPVPTECICISVYNPTVVNLSFSYIDCQGTSVEDIVQPTTTLYVCGKELVGDDGLIIEVNDPCVDNTCPNIPPTPFCYPLNVCELDGFCDVDRYNVIYPFTAIDFLDDVNQQPTCEEIENYVCFSQEELNIEWRATRDQYLKKLNENMLTKYVGYNDNELPYDLTPLQEFLTNPSNNTLFYKPGFKDVNITYARKNSDYSEWFDVICGSDTLNDVFTGVDVFNFLHPVDDVSVAPVGVPGNLIRTTGMTASDYYWSPITNDWVEIGIECVGYKLEDLFATQRANRNTMLKSTNEVILALRPYLYAAYYLPIWQIKKYKGF